VATLEEEQQQQQQQQQQAGCELGGRERARNAAVLCEYVFDEGVARGQAGT